MSVAPHYLPAYVSIRQHTSAYVSIRQYTCCLHTAMTLREFFGVLPTHSDALSAQFQRLLTLPRSAAAAGVMSAFYCFWRIQQELLHPMYAEQLASWYSVKEALLEILTELQQGAPEDTKYAEVFKGSTI